jgi:hypothetical protein
MGIAGCDTDGVHWGLGIDYQYNANVAFGLGFMRADIDNVVDDSVLRFRTRVTF